jgi:citrate lyase beta subunit
METTVKTSLAPESLQRITTPLRKAHKAFESLYPGPRGDRQPVHTVYGGAHLFRSNSPGRLGEKALQALDEYAPDFITFAKAIELPGADRLVESQESAAVLANPEEARQENHSAWFAHTLYQRVREKLLREPVEDFRIDFEDGFGNRPDDEEDRYASAAAGEVATGLRAGTLPPFLGIRIKPFTEELRNRSVRTMDIFLTELIAKTSGRLPENFFITLPKVTIPEESAALATICSRLESALDLKANALLIELMIETPQSIFNECGQVNLLPLAMAAQGRCVAAHFGTYDYTAGRGITAAYQHMTHLSCDFAREVMQVALAGTGIWLSDGATNILPVPLHHPANELPQLTPTQISENRNAVHRAWKLHFDHVRHSLVNGYYQGWDLHPAQLVTRYAAVYSFFLENLDAASERLRNFIAKAAQATLVGEVFDDAATGQGLLNYFLRAINCGAITADEAQGLTSLTPEELRSASFAKILDGRKEIRE